MSTPKLGDLERVGRRLAAVHAEAAKLGLDLGGPAIFDVPRNLFDTIPTPLADERRPSPFDMKEWIGARFYCHKTGAA